MEALKKRRFDLLVGTIIFLVYVMAGKAGLALAFSHASASPVWPPAGIAMAALLIFGNRLWPAVFLGAFTVNITTAGNWVSSLGIATGNCLEAVVGVLLIKRFAKGSPLFFETRTVAQFAFFGAVLSPMISATLGVTSLALTGFAPWDRWSSIWLTWWLGDVVGITMVTPLILLWRYPNKVQWSGSKCLEAAGLLFGILVVGQIVFGRLPPTHHPISYLFLPILVWTAFRFSPRETITAAFLISVMAIAATLGGKGPFVLSSPNESLLMLQGFMGVITLTSLALATVVAQLRHDEDSLRQIQRELEARVRERTEELTSANTRLKLEILEKEKAEEARIRLAAIVESSNDAIIGLNPQGDILSWNHGAEALFGYSANEIVGKNTSILAPPDYPVETHQSGDAEHVETVRMKKNGEHFHVSLSHSPIRGANGELTGISVIARDITRRKRAEQALQEQARELARSNLELSQFAYVASHDLKEPLRMIRAYTQLFEKRYRGKIDHDADEFIGFIVNGAARMHDLIGALLTYSEAGKPGKALETISSEEALQTAISNLRTMIEEAPALIRHEGLPPIRANPVELIQLFQNLLSNSIKFRGARPLTIDVSARQSDGEWVFCISDNGIGIARQHFDRIFEMFQRLHTAADYPGTGIGLAICKKIVEQRSGRIWVESEEGKGSSFFFSFPNG